MLTGRVCGLWGGDLEDRSVNIWYTLDRFEERGASSRGYIYSYYASGIDPC